MFVIKKAQKEHIEGIIQVCTDGHWSTYKNSHGQDYIDRIVKQFYNADRVKKEIELTNHQWLGWFVALEGDEVVGAGGGGMISEEECEIFVLYVNPERRNEGIGSFLLQEITEQHKKLHAKKQWVSVAKGNQKGIPFYLAKGFIYSHDQKSYETLESENYQSSRFYRTI